MDAEFMTKNTVIEIVHHFKDPMWKNDRGESRKPMSYQSALLLSDNCDSVLHYMYTSSDLNVILLTHHPFVPHIHISELGQHWFRYWLVTCTVPGHYLNQCWVIANWTLRNKLQWLFYQNTELFIHENASENIVCKMSRDRWVKCAYLPDAV